MLEINHITKQFKAGRPVFEDISKTFGAGEGVGLIGPNGSGKTTFLRILSVNSYPTSGSVHYNGVNIHEQPREYLEHVGLVHDEETLPQHLTAMELLEWILRSRNRWGTHSYDKMNDLFDTLSLIERDEQIGTYSTGMKKKTQIAAALIIEPDVLIMDEPLRGLDASTRDVVSELITDSKKRRNTLILMASHTMMELNSIFDEIIEFPL